MDEATYQAFSARLHAGLETDPRVLGLALVGSTARQSHAPDEWSDHDFFVVTVDGAQEAMRQTLEWLPDANQIVLSVRETEHGLKVLYGSGHLLEFAVFSLVEVRAARANDYLIAFDRGGVRAALEAIASSAPPAPQTNPDMLRNIGMVLCLLVVGAGRVARGEAISGQVFIRHHALHHLLPVLAQVLSSGDKTPLDNLDPLRRFERVFPEAGARIDEALNREPIQAAQGLLDVLMHYLGAMEGFPWAATETVGDLLRKAAEQAGQTRESDCQDT